MSEPLAPCRKCHGQQITVKSWCIACNDCGYQLGHNGDPKTTPEGVWNCMYMIKWPRQYEDWLIEQVLLIDEAK